MTNLLFITCHDLGRHLGCYGRATVHSPCLDRLAGEGVRFANGFCVAPQCSPSRASMLTGQHPQTHGVMGLAHGDFRWTLRDPAVHLASVLKRGGWHTALAGGQHETHDRAAVGFDEIVGTADFPPCGTVADDCIGFLGRARAATKPFYLQVGFFEPHRGFDYGNAPADRSKGVGLPDYLMDEPSAREEFAQFQGAIRTVDAAIGRVLAALDAGLADDTLVVFAADHGIPFPRAKCSLYDPGLEIAWLMRWPRARWAACGRAITDLASNVDIGPTLLDLLGIRPPHPMQGRSWRGVLEGGAAPATPAIFAGMTYHDYYDPQRCVRTPTHKLIVNFSNAPAFMDPSQQWRPATRPVIPRDPVQSFHPPVELYDLEKDPGETTNLAADPEYADMRGELRNRLLTWMRETADPLLAGVPVSPMHRRTLAFILDSEN